MDKIVNITARAGEKRNNKLRWQEQKIKYGNINIGISRSCWNYNFYTAADYKMFGVLIMKNKFLYKKKLGNPNFSSNYFSY